MLLIQPQFSPITAIKLCNSFKVTMTHGEIPEQFPSPLATELEGLLYLSGDGVLIHHRKCN